MTETVTNIGWSVVFSLVGGLVGMILVLVSSAFVPRLMDKLTPNIDEEKEIVIQVNGRIRERLIVAAGCDKASLKAKALALPKVIEWMGGKEAAKVIVVKDKLVNIVIKG